MFLFPFLSLEKNEIVAKATSEFSSCKKHFYTFWLEAKFDSIVCFIHISRYCRHSFLRYPTQSQSAFGETRGCFEAPKNRKPNKGISCPDILPLHMSDSQPNRDAMKNNDPLDHPDTKGKTRYCLGTRIQMKEGSKGSHKALECSYHDLDLSVEGKMLKSMTQEAMNVCRKFRTIQQVVQIWLNFLYQS